MILFLTVLLGFAWLLLQHAWQALRDLWNEWGLLLHHGLTKPSPCRYRPHPVYRVVFPA